MEDLFLSKRTGKVISFEEYCRSQKEQRKEEVSWRFDPGARQRNPHAKLELLCLFLEVGVRVSILFFILGSIQRPFSR